jgi:hypothetical protein
MKKMIYLLLILIWIWPACTGTKHIQKNRLREKTETTTEQKTETNSQSLTNINQQSTSHTTTTESVDTSVTDPGSLLTAEKKLSELLSGDTMRAESDEQSIEVFYDSLTRTIKAQAIEKPDEIPFQFNRTTETNESLDSQTQKKEITSQVDDKKASEKKEKESESVEKEIKRTYWPVLVGGAVLLAVIILILVWG